MHRLRDKASALENFFEKPLMRIAVHVAGASLL
jgi:hypothetical protein